MKTLILGDLHLDKSFPYTVPESEGAVAWDKYKSKMLLELTSNSKSIIQLGDMFDKHEASGYWLLAASGLFSGKDTVFPLGNHDICYRKRPSTTNLLRTVLLKEPVSLRDVTCLDHCLTQELFDEAVDRLSGGEVLILHCNVGSPRVSYENWLTESKLDKLSEMYKYIFIGHEHKFQQLRENAWYVGTPYPTNFGEMYDHYYGVLEDGGVRFGRSFSVAEEYLEIDVNELLAGVAVSTEVKFIQVVGTIPSNRAAEAYKLIKGLRGLSHVIALKPGFAVKPTEVKVESTEKVLGFDEMLAASLEDCQLEWIKTNLGGVK